MSLTMVDGQLTLSSV